MAAVAYGMRTDDLVFWLDELRESTPVAGGVLCQRHGDSMVVPRGWTLDDLRDPDLHLFRPPSRVDRARPRARRRNGATTADHNAEQLELGGLRASRATDVAQTAGEANDVGTIHAATNAATNDVVDAAPDPAAVATADDAPEPGADPDEQWTPSFDAADDLGGLLSARSPLLSRAFRGTDRPD